MKSLAKVIIPAATLLLTTSVIDLSYAQGFSGFGGGFGGGAGGGATTPTPPATPAWEQFRLDPKTKVKFDFRNASVDAVIQLLSKASQIPIVKDPALTTTITLQSPHPQDLDDAFSELNAVLGLKNYEIDRQGNFLIIQAKQGRGGGFSNLQNLFSGSNNPFSSSSQNELTVYHIKYASASDMATMINNVFTQTTTPAFGFGGFPGFGGGGAQGGAGGGAAGGGGNPFAGFGRRGGGASNQPTVKASADTYSNSLLVSAPSDQQDQIASIIRQIDRPTDTPEKAQVFKLKYALASDMQTVVQNILSGSASLGSQSRVTSAISSQSNQNRGGGFGGFGGFFNRGGGSSNNNSNGTVSADTKSNSLIVTSTDANLSQISDVLAQLDKPATYESTTWVYMLKSARADVVANLLNEAVGNRTTNGPVGGSLTNPTFSSSTLASVGSTASSGTAGTPRNTTNTFQVTSQNSTNSANLTTSTDITGAVVNVRNLTGAVVIVPNIDTNSVIISSPPEDQKVLSDILKQLDMAPKQVMIETMVAEVSLTKADQFGIEYNFIQNNPFGGVHGTLSGSQTFGSGTTPLSQSTAQPGGLQLSLTAGQYSAFVQALSTDTTFDVLDTPRIFTTNNATAQINISQSLPYVTNTTVDTTGTQIINYDFLDVGLVLTVTPRITANGYVTMDVTQTANSFVSYTSFNAPIVDQREAQTTVSVQDGNTVVLGGIISTQLNSTVNKVPLLGDIPLLGNLFRSTNKTKEKTELLVFLTPHVVTTPDDAQAILVSTTKELGKDSKVVVPDSVLNTPVNEGGITPTTAPADSAPAPATPAS